MLDHLTQRLGRVVKTLRGEARLTESNIDEALRDVPPTLAAERLAEHEAQIAAHEQSGDIDDVAEPGEGEA